jgi:Protein of unknown function (DUF1566)
MRKKIIKSPACLVLLSLSVLWLLSNSAMAEGDGGWTTTTSPEYIFQIEEDLLDNQNYMFMTVLNPGFYGAEIYSGPASGSVGSTYLLEPWRADSDMTATWQFNSDIQATVIVESCTYNCLWQPGQVVALNKIFGDNLDSQTGERYGGCTCSGTMNGTRWCDNQDGTVTDLTTCLVWLKDASWGGRYPLWVSVQSNTTAHDRAAQLKDGVGGLSDGSVEGDWRLATRNELHGLANGTEFVRSGSMRAFTGVKPSYYFSSTPCESEQDCAWTVYMLNGDVTGYYKALPGYVWPVRSDN